MHYNFHFNPPLNIDKFEKLEDMVESESYIKYYKGDSHGWKLDNGSDFPEIKYLKNTSFDPQTRTFEGLLDWGDTPIWNDRTWNFKIIFNEDYKKFEGGHVIYLANDGHQNAKT